MDETVKAFMDAMMADIKAATSPEVAAKITPLFSKHSALLGKPAAPAGGDKGKKQFSERDLEFRQLQAKVRLGENKEYLGTLNDRVTPAIKKLALPLLEMAHRNDNPQEVENLPESEMQFSVDDKKVNGVQLVKSLLETLPKSVEFGEVANAESAKNDGTITFADIDEIYKEREGRK